MRRPITSLLLVLLCARIGAGADSHTFAGLTLSLPDGWKVESDEQLSLQLPTVKLKHGSDVLMITVLPKTPDTLDSLKELEQFLLERVKPIERESVEQNTTAKHLKTEKIVCAYAAHTDKNLVGKPVSDDNWMYTIIGFAQIKTSLVHFTYFTNDKQRWQDEKGLALIKTLRPSEGDEQAKQDTFAFELREHGVQISIPELPAVKLGPHPLRKSAPHLGHLGSKPPYHISILLPTVDDGMTSLEFADARVKDLAAQHGLSQKQYRVYRQPNKESFSMFYAVSVGKLSQLHAHLFAVSGPGTHGVEVHVSSMASGADRKEKWLQGFPQAVIGKIDDADDEKKEESW